MRAVHIQWDAEAEVLSCLPDCVAIPADITDVEEISDYLSDITGFCHKGFVLLRNAEFSVDAYDRGRHLIREYYTQEALDEMRREFVKLNLPSEEFPVYVAWCYDQEQADPYDLHQP